MKMEVIVRYQTDGIHYYPAPPPGVEFLGTKHHHRFDVEVSVQETDDREVEFFILRSDIQEFFSQFPVSKGIRDFGTMSCETIATELGKFLVTKGYRVVSVSVFEDNYAGSRVWLS